MGNPRFFVRLGVFGFKFRIGNRHFFPKKQPILKGKDSSLFMSYLASKLTTYLPTDFFFAVTSHIIAIISSVETTFTYLYSKLEICCAPSLESLQLLHKYPSLEPQNEIVRFRWCLKTYKMTLWGSQRWILWVLCQQLSGSRPLPPMSAKVRTS